MPDQDIFVTVDCVVIAEEDRSVLLIKRKNEPFKGEWALPGGFVEYDEDLPNAATRELQEETGLNITAVKEIGAFGKPKRDPRGRTISIAFYASIKKIQQVKGNDDAEDAKWFKISELKRIKLAFDHAEIIQKGMDRYF